MPIIGEPIPALPIPQGPGTSLLTVFIVTITMPTALLQGVTWSVDPNPQDAIAQIVTSFATLRPDLAATLSVAPASASVMGVMPWHPGLWPLIIAPLPSTL